MRRRFRTTYAAANIIKITTTPELDIVLPPLHAFAARFNNSRTSSDSIPRSQCYGVSTASQVLDLNGFTRGTISQDFPTLAGQVYLTTFAYADNPRESGLSTASISVTDVGTTASLLNDSVAHSSSSDSIANYVTYSKSFTAVGALSRLTIASTSPSGDPSGGIFLDAVAVTSVPEPTSLVLLATSGCALGTFKRRQLNRRNLR